MTCPVKTAEAGQYAWHGGPESIHEQAFAVGVSETTITAAAKM
ncbi:MAG TPA: hypothetical protein VFH01_06775 [Pyrinomonadaceae bacterium]|nr:hypothetical protein [Pyrinomonadaceae bacterium]